MVKTGTKMGGRLKGKTVIVTGAARGVGASIVELFAGEGAQVLGTDIRDELGQEVADRVDSSEPGTARYRHLDVRSPAEWAETVEFCEAELGPPNVLVSNAYIYNHPRIHEITLEEWEQSLDVNLNGGFHGIRAVLPGMRERKEGTIVAISSTNGNEINLPQTVSYQAAKAGLTSIIRHVGVVYGSEGIRANAIHPGPIRTPSLVDANFLEAAEFIATGFPIARIAEPEEIAWAAVFLASDESSYITAEKLVIDGGSVATLNFPGQDKD